MAFLKILKGGSPGQWLELKGDQMLLGRHPSCQIVVDNQAVSRYHAQILQSHGSFFLEDLRSRNGTLLNGLTIEGRTELHEKDEVKICDLVFQFYLKIPRNDDSSVIEPEQLNDLNNRPLFEPNTTKQPRHKNTTKPGTDHELEAYDEEPPAEPYRKQPDESSSILSTLSATQDSDLRLNIKPEAKLRAVLEMTKALGAELKLEDSLQEILTGLFRIFPQSDNGFVMLRDPERGKLVIRASKTRTGEQEVPRPSMTIVRQVIQTRQAVLSADAIQDRRFSMSESLDGLQIRCMMCAPLISRSGDVLGVLQINTRDLVEPFKEDDLDVFVSVCSQAVLAVDYARMHEELLVQQDRAKEMELAAQVQHGFLPKERPQGKGYDFAEYYESALEVGGDYMDYFTLPDGRIAFAIGDVAGKGVSAALLMARLYSAARYHFLMTNSVGDAMTGLNTELATAGLGHRFITCVLGILDPVSHQMHLANAGHMSPIFRSPNGKTRTVPREHSGLPLGILKGQKFQSTTVNLAPGDSCVLFTDGITETMNNKPKKEIYGMTRLQTSIGRFTNVPERMIQEILTDLEEYSEGAPQRDDMCLLIVKRHD